MDKVISDIVDSKTMAVVGVSRRKFGGAIYKTLKKLGYTVYAVHPTLESFDGDECCRSLTELPNGVSAAVVAVSAENALSVVDDAVKAGVAKLWFQQGPNFSEAIRRAEEHGIACVSRKCILMYAEPVGGIHAFHRFLARLFSRY